MFTEDSSCERLAFMSKHTQRLRLEQGKLSEFFPRLKVKNRKVTIYISHTSEWQ